MFSSNLIVDSKPCENFPPFYQRRVEPFALRFGSKGEPGPNVYRGKITSTDNSIFVLTSGKRVFSLRSPQREEGKS